MSFDDTQSTRPTFGFQPSIFSGELERSLIEEQFSGKSIDESPDSQFPIKFLRTRQSSKPCPIFPFRPNRWLKSNCHCANLIHQTIDALQTISRGWKYSR
ncbi:unnamed protein product [Caenorhabditis angaria]|uniref:Uncharacterized protein n=1 Tax=Caenorhabditis angaria TaxID=860376 RepID=A0A9P1IVU2_9PELO|nr:unnamed protein product [Caenorhabditis angaria]